MLKEKLLEKKAALQNELGGQILTSEKVEEINKQVEEFKKDLLDEAKEGIEANRVKIQAKIEVINELLEDEPEEQPITISVPSDPLI